MQTSLFDFHLPPDRIALRPVEPRDAARLLRITPSFPPHDDLIRNLPNFLNPGDALVVNDTRVIPARLSGFRQRGDTRARIEVTLHQRTAPSQWRAFVRPAKKLNVGEIVRFGAESESVACLAATLDAHVLEKGRDGEILFGFDFTGPVLDEAIARVGHMPLPPYIAARRAQDARDIADYQTLFATNPGAVAAPTAGLHFTPSLLAAIEARGVEVHRVTLHVGAGTFLPVKAEDIADHRMHAETGEVSAATATALRAVKARGGRVMAVGTTALRVLESAAAGGALQAFSGDTRIFITPGYQFRVVDLLLTNFHLPRSTLFMLVSAFCGLETMQSAYAHAIEHHYRFYSYGDACLLTRA